MFLSGMVGTASQKKYKITNTLSSVSFPEYAFPGEYVVARLLDGSFYGGHPTITSNSGIRISTSDVDQSYFDDIVAYVADPGMAVIFVMPAEDVTIS